MGDAQIHREASTVFVHRDLMYHRMGQSALITMNALKLECVLMEFASIWMVALNVNAKVDLNYRQLGLLVLVRIFYKL